MFSNVISTANNECEVPHLETRCASESLTSFSDVEFECQESWKDTFLPGPNPFPNRRRKAEWSTVPYRHIYRLFLRILSDKRIWKHLVWRTVYPVSKKYEKSLGLKSRRCKQRWDEASLYTNGFISWMPSLCVSGWSSILTDILKSERNWYNFLWWDLETQFMNIL